MSTYRPPSPTAADSDTSVQKASDDEEPQPSSGDDSTYTGKAQIRRKRRKVTRTAGRTSARRAYIERETRDVVNVAATRPPFDCLLDLLPEDETVEVCPFEDFIEAVLPELIDACAAAQVERLNRDIAGQQVVPMSRLQRKLAIDRLPPYAAQSPIHAIMRRRLMTQRGNLRSLVLGVEPKLAAICNSRLSPLVLPRSLCVNPEVLEALCAIQSTPYESSFLSRLRGLQPSQNRNCLALDWDNRTPWMELMKDIRDHFSLLYPDREQPPEVEAPIEYVGLQDWHLPQVHAMLTRAFWDGIDVSDSLHYSPERCTVVALYKKMVVGVALLSSPEETYITYLAVLPGWDNAQIATSMLYHLITLNPQKDITLHVSINNPAVLLYNRFGFKAEEFIVGFYENYLDPITRASKNAFRLRLRR